MKLILGSSSPFRKSLLERLLLEFDTYSPDIDETSHEGESPSALVKRLSIAKAEEIAKDNPNSLIIGSDQVAVFDNQILGKPGNHENAVMQLTKFSTHSVKFITGLCLFNSKTLDYQYHQDETWVHFRKLSALQIEYYLKNDSPYQCAGSFRSEGLGCSLFSSIESSDPNALIGLPIIKLVEMLESEGIDVLN
ncbi:MAG: septum formation protein [Enterobacterales bacterium]